MFGCRDGVGGILEDVTVIERSVVLSAGVFAGRSVRAVLKLHKRHDGRVSSGEESYSS